MYMADTLSRAYLPVTDEENRDSVFAQSSVVQHLPVSTETLRKLQLATEADENLKELMSVIHRVWPDSKDSLSSGVQTYFPLREELKVQDGLVFNNDRVVVSLSERHDMMERAHSSHIGLQTCLKAKESVYWPNLYSDFESYIRICDTCNTYLMKNTKEPMIPHETPSRPWEKVGVDLVYGNGNDYLLTVDYYSEIDRLHDKTSTEVIRMLKAHFSSNALPGTVVSDNGPPFNGKQLMSFAKGY